MISFCDQKLSNEVAVGACNPSGLGIKKARPGNMRGQSNDILTPKNWQLLAFVVAFFFRIVDAFKKAGFD